MDDAAARYLLRRGYTPDLIAAEPITGLDPGRHDVAGIEVRLAFPSVAFLCRTPSGALAGVHLAAWGGEKRYEWRENRQAPYLPICYALPDDWEAMDRSGEVILTEGVFDRIALKRAFPDRAVVARLSKSIYSVAGILRRYTSRVWLAFDRDEQGDLGADKARRALERDNGPEVQRLDTFRGKDPAEHLERYDLASLQAATARRLEALTL